MNTSAEGGRSPRSQTDAPSSLACHVVAARLLTGMGIGVALVGAVGLGVATLALLNARHSMGVAAFAGTLGCGWLAFFLVREGTTSRLEVSGQVVRIISRIGTRRTTIARLQMMPNPANAAGSIVVLRSIVGSSVFHCDASIDELRGAILTLS